MASYRYDTGAITPVVRVQINTFNLEIDVDYLSMIDVKPLIRLVLTFSNPSQPLKQIVKHGKGHEILHIR